MDRVKSGHSAKRVKPFGWDDKVRTVCCRVKAVG
jgi:hypothetical protein